MNNDAFGELDTTTVEAEYPMVRDVMVEPLEFAVEIDPTSAPRERAPAQDVRFPVPLIQVNVKVLPVENEITVSPSLTAGFDVDYVIGGVIDVTPELTGDLV